MLVFAALTEIDLLKMYRELNVDACCDASLPQDCN